MHKISELLKENDSLVINKIKEKNVFEQFFKI